jgi:hypothetical protein
MVAGRPGQGTAYLPETTPRFLIRFAVTFLRSPSGGNPRSVEKSLQSGQSELADLIVDASADARAE